MFTLHTLVKDILIKCYNVLGYASANSSDAWVVHIIYNVYMFLLTSSKHPIKASPTTYTNTRICVPSTYLVKYRPTGLEAHYTAHHKTLSQNYINQSIS